MRFWILMAVLGGLAVARLGTVRSLAFGSLAVIASNLMFMTLAFQDHPSITGLAIVEPDRKLMPPEPFRWAGGTAIRAALVRRDAAYDQGREPDPVTGFVASLPRRLGLRLPR